MTQETRTYFSPSVNIERDFSKELNYVVTNNATEVFSKITGNFETGTRAFNIIGAYGSGKSSFLWALSQTLSGNKQVFEKNSLKPQFEVFSMIGDYRSISEYLAEKLGIEGDWKSKDIIASFEDYYVSLNDKGLIILIDEFGKFLEFAAKHNPDFELYFIQQLAEFANDSSKEIILVTTLHQDFSAYGLELSKAQRLEWDKVKGRLKEITFNEPVEQLLYLASERLKDNKVRSAKLSNKLFGSIVEARVFPLRDYLNEEMANKLLPFDILSASVLTLALQRYGQNERSLFSFIESNDHLGINEFEPTKGEPYYHLGKVYDYLIHNFYSFLTTKYNPDYSKWNAIKLALEKIDGQLEEGFEEAKKLIKTIGLLNIFAPASSRIDETFLVNYSEISLGIHKSNPLIEDLTTKQIIRFVKHNWKYILFEGTDLDIELAIDEAGQLVEKVYHVEQYLNEYFEFPFISAKAYQYEIGTPRFFAFRLSDKPINLVPQQEIDGYINLIFSEKLSEKAVKKASEECEEAILFGLFTNTVEIKKLIFEIEKVKKVLDSNRDDKVAARELNSILNHQKNLLNYYVIGSIYRESSGIEWYFKGEKLTVKDRAFFNRLLSRICHQVYEDTPVYINEMVNKTKLSGPILTARKSLIKSIVHNYEQVDLGFEEQRFPPEKTIYLSLIKETGLHSQSAGSYTLQIPEEQSFKKLWEACAAFVDSSKDGKKSVIELVEMLQARPFKLKQGLIEFWVPIFLFAKHDDYALFNKEVYIPYINDEVLDLLIKKPQDYSVKAFDLAGIRLEIFNQYRKLIDQTQSDEVSNDNFIETIRPFLTFYKDLPIYAKTTQRLSAKAQKLREAIKLSKDPEKAFFEDFPNALGYSIEAINKNELLLDQYFNDLQDGIKSIRNGYGDLVDRFEGFIQEEIVGSSEPFPEYKQILVKRFERLKSFLLNPEQKVFNQRLISPLDDRKSWLSSLAQSIIGKSLDSITDADENILYERFRARIYELDNLCEIEAKDVDQSKEEVLKLEITTFLDGVTNDFIRLPKKQTKKVKQLESEIKPKLSDDKQVNIAMLTRLLQEELKK
ncbi:MAG: hypothetical protein AAGA64_12045 [Bacteroidota bacterium]